jgi:hypothetical protein
MRFMREHHYILPIPPVHLRNVPNLMKYEIERDTIKCRKQGDFMADAEQFREGTYFKEIPTR